MLRLAADENFNNDIVRGIVRRRPGVDLLRVQDAGLTGRDDPTILEWAAREGRLVLTHDAATMTDYAYQRAEARKSMPGVVEVNRSVPVGVAIEDILILAEYSREGEWEGQVLYLPLR